MTQRLFLAVAVTEDVRRGLAALLSDRVGILPGRSTPPANWHLTLRFLGETDGERRDRVIHFLDEHLETRPFTLGFSTLGAFPRPKRATVLWLGVGAGADRLDSLAAVSEEAARTAGFEPEERPFHPHLTLARIRPAADVGAVVEQTAAFPLTMRVDRLTLFRSVAGPHGVRYRVVDELPLK